MFESHIYQEVNELCSRVEAMVLNLVQPKEEILEMEPMRNLATDTSGGYREDKLVSCDPLDLVEELLDLGTLQILQKANTEGGIKGFVLKGEVKCISLHNTNLLRKSLFPNFPPRKAC